MRVPFFARLSDAHSVLRALKSRVSFEVAWLSLLWAMWLTYGVLLRRVFLYSDSGMCLPLTPVTSILTTRCSLDTPPGDGRI